jgi:hypothetical protein
MVKPSPIRVAANCSIERIMAQRAAYTARACIRQYRFTKTCLLSTYHRAS